MAGGSGWWLTHRAKLSARERERRDAGPWWGCGPRELRVELGRYVGLVLQRGELE